MLTTIITSIITALIVGTCSHFYTRWKVNIDNRTNSLLKIRHDLYSNLLLLSLESFSPKDFIIPSYFKGYGYSLIDAGIHQNLYSYIQQCSALLSTYKSNPKAREELIQLTNNQIATIDGSLTFWNGILAKKFPIVYVLFPLILEAILKYVAKIQSMQQKEK